MRRLALWLSSLLVLSSSFVATGSPAFAMRVGPAGSGPAARVGPAGGGPAANSSPPVHHAAGLSAWQIAVIVIAGLVVVGALIVGRVLVRASRRTASSPASG
jgi:hypothetical protein